MPSFLEVTRARSFLFVPASRPQRFSKALESGAGCVILDLEDAVAPDGKVDARIQMAHQLASFTRPQLNRTLVRINASGSDWYADDVKLMAKWTARGLAGVMVPKCEEPTTLQSLGAALDPKTQLVPLIESLAGLDAVDLLAQVPGVSRLAFGHVDFQLDMCMRCEIEEVELAPVRFTLVAASRRANIAGPIDGVTLDVADAERTKADAMRGRAIGFAGKLCIHPSQVSPTEEAFSPTIQELNWARRVMAEAHAHKGQAFSIDGKMVDLPVIHLAERTLRNA